MKEDDLFNGYSANARAGLDLFDEVDPNELLVGRIQCEEGSCPVMIATWTGRRICRYHQRKREDGELSTVSTNDM